MSKKLIRVLSYIVAIMLTAWVMIGCREQSNKQAGSDNSKQGNSSAQSAGEVRSGPLALKFWVPLDAKAAVTMKSHAENKMYQELQKRFNIKIEFQHPPLGQESEQLNLMLASRDLPDLIGWSWSSVPGGPVKVYQDNIIIRMNDLIDKHGANLKKVYEKYPEARKQTVLDDGTMYMFPFFRLEAPVRINQGIIIRKDWMNKLGLKSPATIQDWYGVLKAFKEKDPNGNGTADELPLVNSKQLGLKPAQSLTCFATAWGVRKDFSLKNGKVVYGPIEPEFKEFLTEMNKWYKEKLIDPDYLATDGKGFDAKITGNQAGAFYGFMNGEFGKYMTVVGSKDPTFELAGVPAPIGPAGKSYSDSLDLNRLSPGWGVAITSSCKYKEEVVKILDFGYGEEGTLLYNFGIKDESYVMENGYPKYKDVILKNPEGLAPTNAIIRYALATISGPFIQDKRYADQMRASIPQQLEAEKEWGKSADTLLMPPVTPSEAESVKMANIISQTSTYVDEAMNKFIMGQKPIESFDAYVKDLKTMGIDEAIKLQQAALDRYNKR